MPGYRVFLFKDGHIHNGLSIEAKDDAAAFTQAQILSGRGSFEVWQGKRMVVSQDAPIPAMSKNTA